MIRRVAILFVAVFMIAFQITAEESTLLRRGIDLYGAGKWRDAIITLRQASAEAIRDEASEALYWIALAELGSGEYEASLKDLEELLKTAPAHPRALEAPYQKGRVLYHLGRFDDAIVVLKTYTDTVMDDLRRSAATYWVGESLYSLGRFDDARSIFALIIEKYPNSPKFESSTYRIALIDQKARESELLKLLKWSHEESLKTVEEYQRRERSYEQAIVAYQKRIAEMLKDTRLADLEKESRSLTEKNGSLESALKETKTALDAQNLLVEESRQSIERLNSELVKSLSEKPATPMVVAPITNTDRIARLLAIKAEALSIKETIIERIAAQVDARETVK
jgi:tetratricopeptide (TPR) repeat protein